MDESSTGTGENNGGRRFIVVGVDGSEPGKDALSWAARQARLTGADLHAVGAWDLPVGYGFAPDDSWTDLSARARDELDATIAQVLGDVPDLQVIARVEQGHPAEVLVETSRGADLLVVGSRGRGTFKGALLGSVSQHCAQQATCPVLIVRAENE